MRRFRYGRWLIVLFLAAVCLSPTPALASIKGIEVPCRVEPNIISLTITTDGTVAYGVLDLSATENTTASGVDDTEIVSNNGTETVTFNIKSSHALGGTQWSLGAAAGGDTFTHTASIDGGSTWDIAMTVVDEYVTLDTNVAPAGTVDVDLQIEMPTSITDYTQKTITVTIQAVGG